VDLLRMPLKIR